MSALPGYINRECVNTLFLLNSKAFKYKDVSFNHHNIYVCTAEDHRVVWDHASGALSVT